MKRFLSIALVALLLVFSLAVISPAVSAEEITLPFFIVDFNGSVFMLDQPSAFSWDEAFRLNRFVPIDGVSFDRVYGYSGLVYDPDNDGVGEKYQLVYTDIDGRKKFVLPVDDFITHPYNEIEDFVTNHPNYTNNDLFSNFDHYETECTIRVLLDGGREYAFTYPTTIFWWQDLVKQPDYVHPDLGTCRFEVADGALYLSIGSGSGSGNTLKYSLVDEFDRTIAPTYSIFSNQEAETTVSLLPLCSEGSHDLVKEIKTLPSCTTDGLQVLSCSKCDYSAEYSIPANDHSYTKLIEKYEPTCPQVGYKIYQCGGCAKRIKVDVPIKHNYTPATCTSPASCTGCGISNALALGHDYDFLGRCKRDGCGSSLIGNFFGNAADVVGDAVGAVGDALFGDPSDGESSDGESSDGDSSDGMKNVGNVVTWILGLVFGIALLFLLWPLLKSLVDLIASGVKALVSGIKNLSNRSKSKKKKKS